MTTESAIYNFEAQYVAAQLGEAGLLGLNDIYIRPDDDTGKVFSREITAIQISETPVSCVILTNRQSRQRLELYQAIRNDDLARELFYLLEHEMNRFRVQLALDEMEFASSITREERACCVWPVDFSEQEQAILSYYLPFAAQIRADPELAARCFSAISEQPVSIRRIKALEKRVEQHRIVPLGAWQIDHNALLDGAGPSEAPCYLITIGPLATGTIPSFLPGNNYRRFIEQGLCPLFLPESSDWQIALLAQNENFVLSEGKTVCFMGINSRLI